MYASFLALWSAALVVAAALIARAGYALRAQLHQAHALGSYTLEEEIGQGGMGVVYRASHAMLCRPTAIKLLHRENGGTNSVARFEREVRMTSRLTHPNTVAIYDYGRTSEGRFYYAMEYLEGPDLQRLVEREGPQSAARVVHILLQVCGALAEAHDLGLVHRDIKPANVILCVRGGVSDVAKVVDFGLVKRLADVGSADATAVGAVVGTPLYMSPEAIVRPDLVDGRSDLYALGALAYFLLTGAPPFEGATSFEVCSRHLHAEPARLSTKVAVPPDLERVVLWCLAKSPDDRPASARALRDALAACELRNRAAA